MNKFWNEMFKLPKPNKPKAQYVGRKKCDEYATKHGFEIWWDYAGRGMHTVKPDEMGEGIAYNTNEVMERMTDSRKEN